MFLISPRNSGSMGAAGIEPAAAGLEAVWDIGIGETVFG